MEGIAITLDKKELIFLAALLDEAVVLGVEDPFSGWLAEQVEEEWRKLSPGMLENGLLYDTGDGNFAVNSDIEKMVRLCCSPDLWVSVIISRYYSGSSSFVLNIDIPNKKMVKVSMNQQNSNVELLYGRCEEKASIEIIAALGIGNKIACTGGRFDITEKAFESIMEDHTNVSRHELDSSIRNVSHLEDFFKTIKEAKSKILVNIGSFKTYSSNMTSLVLIEGENCLWRVKYYDDKSGRMVSVRRCGSNEMLNELDDIMNIFV